MIRTDKTQVKSGTHRSKKRKPLLIVLAIVFSVALLHFILAQNPNATDAKSFYMPALLFFAGIGIAIAPFIGLMLIPAGWSYDTAAGVESQKATVLNDRKRSTVYLVGFARFGGPVAFIGSYLYGLLKLESGFIPEDDRPLFAVLLLMSVSWTLIGIFGWLGFGVMLNLCAFLFSLYLTNGMPKLDALGATTDSGWAAAQVGVVYALAFFVLLGVLIRNLISKSKAAAAKRSTSGSQS